MLFTSLFQEHFLFGTLSTIRILFLTCTSKSKPVFIIEEFRKSALDLLPQLTDLTKTPIAMMDVKGAGFSTRASVFTARGMSSISDTLNTYIWLRVNPLRFKLFNKHLQIDSDAFLYFFD